MDKALILAKKKWFKSTFDSLIGNACWGILNFAMTELEIKNDKYAYKDLCVYLKSWKIKQRNKMKKKSYRQREKLALAAGFQKVYPYREIGSGAVRWFKNGVYYHLKEIFA